MKRIVQNLVTRPGGAPLADKNVSFQMCVGAFADAGQREVLTTTYATTDATGLWAVSLDVNADLEPGGTYYTVREGQGVIHPFVVPAGAEPVWLHDCLVDPVPVITDQPAPTTAYVDGGDAATLVAAKAYTDSHGGGGGSAGVSSFAGRSGAVTPQLGDYTADQVGAATLAEVGQAISAQGDALVAYVQAQDAATASAAHSDAVALIAALGLGTASTKAVGDFATPAQLQVVADAVSALTNGSPELLNTLDELAAAIGDDPNFAATVTAAIAGKYTKPGTGIPASDLAASVQALLGVDQTARDAAAAAITTAASDAAVKANAAQSAAVTAAAADATSKANAAQAAAISAAASDATTKANAAQAAATSAAATDATSKANAAQSAAVTAAAADATSKVAAAQGLPAYAPSGLTRQYDALRCAHNCTASVLAQIRAALGKARAGIGLAHILVFGDSQSAGNMGSLAASPRDQEHAYAAMLRAALKLAGVPLAGTGWKTLSACRQAQAQPNPPWTFTGTWSSAWISKCTTNGGVATLTATAEEGVGTNVDLAYLDQAASLTIGYAVKDSSGTVLTSGTITPGGTNVIKVLQLTGLAGVKSVDITSNSTNTQVLAANIYRTTGLLVSNLAYDGTNAAGVAGWADNTATYYGPASKTVVPAPDLTIATVGGNDELAGTATATNMTAIAASHLRWPNASHIQIGQWQSNSRTVAQWNTFIGAQYTQAETSGLGLVDVYARTGGYAAMAARGTITDAGVTHPNQAAHAELGAALADLLIA